MNSDDSAKQTKRSPPSAPVRTDAAATIDGSGAIEAARSDVRRGSPHPDVELDAERRAAAESADSPRSDYDSELTMLLRRAACIGRGKIPYVSFSSLFLAFFASDDPISLWMQEKAQWIGPRIDDIVRQWTVHAPHIAGLSEDRIEEAADRDTDDLPDQYQSSPSAQNMLELAATAAERLGDARPLGVRHLMVAYLYFVPEDHLRDLAAWGIDREGWTTRLMIFAVTQHPEQAEAWRRLHDTTFPRPFSTSVTTAMRWASAHIGNRSDDLDSEHLLTGILLEGLADSRSSAAQLVKQIGEGIAELGLEADNATDLPEEILPLAEELAPIVDRARLFATVTRPPRDAEPGSAPTLNVRHLIAALFTDRRELAAFTLVRRAGRTESGVLTQFRDWLEAVGPGNDDRQRWRALFDELRDPIISGYDNDEAHGEDRLGISKDVRALAAVLVSTQVTPPLSVGLFGDWGSGKSFFMGKLRDRIKILADAAKANPSADSWFCGKRGAVVQVDFNAWHYMDADLWSSLAVRVFDTLSEELKEQFAQACRDKLDSLKERENELKTKRKALGVASEDLETLLQQQRSARALREVRLGELMKRLALEQIEKIKAHPDISKVTEQLRLEGSNVRRELQSAQRDLQYVGGRAELWWRTLHAPARAVTVLLSLGLPAIATVMVTAVFANAGATIATFLTSYAAALALFGSKVRSFIARVAGPIDTAISEVARIEQTIRDDKTTEERALEAERDGASARIAELEREQLQVSKRKAEIEAELAALQQGDAKTLREFILERAAAQDYRKNLGVISAIHKDFQQLASFLDPSKDGPNVERIVLYIDDLDRCPPQRVVEVLQAIHIILSLRLFVVVVAVDSRWLLDSLTAIYRTQFPGGTATIDETRPQQYLEKIFQVPFTLTPMTPMGYGALVGAMLPSPVDAPGLPAPGPRSTEADLAPARGPRVTAKDTQLAPAMMPRHERIDLTPRSLQLEPEELAHLRTLSRLLPTPRAAKRLVNLYRIVRASLDNRELTRLLNGEYRAIQICLGVVIGHPSFGADLFGQVLSGAMQDDKALVAWQQQRRNRAAELPAAAAARELSALAALDEHMEEFADWPVAVDAMRKVARFSFETGRILTLYPAR